MSYRYQFFLALMLCFSASFVTAAELPTDGGKTATRCAMFYLLVSYVPAESDRKEHYNSIIEDLGKLATAGGATDADVATWSREYLEEASREAKIKASTFNQDQSKLCQALLDSMSAQSSPAT